MGKVVATSLGGIIGGFVAAVAVALWLGWGTPWQGQAAHVDPTRADYVDLLLAVATISLGAVGVAVTVGALVIGFIALKTLHEIKEEAVGKAKDVAKEAVDVSVHKILRNMADNGELGTVLDRVIQAGGPEEDPESPGD